MHFYRQDYLYVYDGNNTMSPLKKACSGSYSAGSYVISSSGNAVLLHFTSDSDGVASYPGFNIKFMEGKYLSLI